MRFCFFASATSMKCSIPTPARHRSCSKSLSRRETACRCVACPITPRAPTSRACSRPGAEWRCASRPRCRARAKASRAARWSRWLRPGPCSTRNCSTAATTTFWSRWAARRTGAAIGTAPNGGWRWRPSICRPGNSVPFRFGSPRRPPAWRMSWRVWLRVSCWSRSRCLTMRRRQRAPSTSTFRGRRWYSAIRTGSSMSRPAPSRCASCSA